MRRLFLLLIVLSGGLLVGLPASAQKPAPKGIVLSYRPQPGELYEVIDERRETEGGNMTGVRSQADPFDLFGTERETITLTRINSQWRVLDRDADGNSVIDITYKYVRVGKTIGRIVNRMARFIPVDAGVFVIWDTRESIKASNPFYASAESMQPSEQRDNVLAMFRQLEAVRTALANYLVDHTFRIIVDKQGRVVDVQGMDLLLDGYRTELARLKPDIETRAKQDAIVNSFMGEDAIRQSLTATNLLHFPASAVAVGGKWSDTFDFDLIGNKIPVKRDFTLVKKADYSDRFEVSCKTAVEVTPPTAKDVRITSRFDQTAEVDPLTGTYYERKQTGSLEVRKNGADAKVEPQAFIRSTQKVTYSGIATRDARDRSTWEFYGGYTDFTIKLGEKWTRLEPDPNRFSEGIFEEQRTGMRIDYAITDRKSNGLTQKVTDDRQSIETRMRSNPEISNVTVTELKTYKAGPVEWVRLSLELEYRSGKQEHYIVQDGFTASLIYRFMLLLPSGNTPAKRAEAFQIFDSIDIKRAE